MRFFLGTYTDKLGHVDGAGPGVVRCDLDVGSGAIRVAGPPVTLRNPSCLWLNHAGDRLYACSEICDYRGNPDGIISAIAVNRESGGMVRIHESTSAGAGPAYLAGDRGGRFLLVANYVEGNVAVLPMLTDGRIGKVARTVRHFGTGPIKSRQEAPHPHAIMAGPDNRFVHVADLGTDRLESYRFDAGTGSLVHAPESSLSLPAGSGPRHLAFHPNGRILLVDLELSSEVAVLRWDPKAARFHVRQIISTKAPAVPGHNHPSEIVITRDGRHVYVANRGHDNVAGFTLDAAAGTLSPLGHWPCGGKTPRHIALSPDDRHLLVANQDSGSVNALARDPGSGSLSLTRHALPVPTPCWVLFAHRLREGGA